MCGGLNKVTLEASPDSYKFSLSTIRHFKSISPLKHSRYGHATVYINQLVLAMGGYSNREDDPPQTMSSCEKYSVKENEW